MKESSSELDPRLEQLRRLEDWLGRLPAWQQHLLAIALALITGALAVWLNSVLPPIDVNSIGPFVP